MDGEGGIVGEQVRLPRFHFLAQAHVRELEVSLPVQEDVVRLEVAVDVAQCVHGGDCHDHLGHVLAGGRFGEGVFSDQEGHQISTGEEFHHHVEHLPEKMK